MKILLEQKSCTELSTLWSLIEQAYKNMSAANTKVAYTKPATYSPNGGTSTVIPEEVTKFFELTNKFLTLSNPNFSF